MKTWIVRLACLYLFNLLVLWIISWLSPADVGLSIFWAAVVLSLATLWIRPAVTKLFRKQAAKSIQKRTKVSEALLQYGIALGVAAIVWIFTVIFSGVRIGGGFGNWVLAWVVPPIILSIAWAIYAVIDSKVEAAAGKLYDKAMGGPAVRVEAEEAIAPDGRVEVKIKEEVSDGLTPEQRRMLKELGDG